MTNKGLSISVVLIPAAEVLKKCDSGLKGKIDTFSIYHDQSNFFFAPLSCYAESTHHIGGRKAEQKHILLPLRRIAQWDGYIWQRNYSSQLRGLPYSAIPWKQKQKEIFLPSLQYFFPVERHAIPNSDFQKFAISAEYFFSNGFTISSATYLIAGCPPGTYFVGGCPLSNPKWFPPDNSTHDCTLIIPEESTALVEFKDMTSPAEYQNSFLLGIYHKQPVSIFLLPHNGKPFSEVGWEARRKSCDRAAIALLSGHVISVALRKRVRDGELMYAVDFDVRLSSSIQNLAVERCTPPQEILSLTTSIERTN
jgi:hypothetical protein